MTTVEFLAQLHDLGVKLWVENDRLRYRGSKEALTPALMAELVARKTDLLGLLTAAVPTTTIPRARRDGPLPLSFAQQRLWLLDQIQPNTATYNLPIALRLTGLLDISALSETLNTIGGRHEVLRTTFAPGPDNEPVQIIAPAAPQHLPLVDLQDLPAAERLAKAQRLVEAEQNRPFDLTHGPLLRTTLLKLGPDEHLLLLTMHHIIGDGWSLGVLVQEVAALYPAYAQQTPPLLPDLTIQYADFAIWQRAQLSGEVLDREIDYWRQQLASIPPLLELPADHPRPPVQSFRGAAHTFPLLSPLSALKTLSDGAGTTLFQTLLAAFDVLLYRYTGQDDLVVGSPIAGRTQPELEPLIGFFVNTLVLRADLAGNPRFVDLLQQIRRTTLDAHAHQHVPFEKLVEVLHPERNLSYAPLFQVMFVFQNAPAETLDLPGLTLSPVPAPSSSAKFDLMLTLVETGPELICELEYSTDLFEAATIERMAGHFQTLVAGIVANPEQHIAYLPLQTEAEQQCLIDWNRSETEYPRAAAVHQLIETQAERTPTTAAIVFAVASLTYAELNARANQLAHYLRDQGVGPDVLVALMVERSLEMIVGMLAILKAGGAYVPLDPAYPAERLQYMLSHSQAPIILTQDRLVAHLPEHTAQVFRLDADWERLANQPATNPPRVVLPDHLAYVIYTSGSTGRPKGVMVTQQGVLNLVHGLRAYFDDPAVHNVGLITSISFDISVNQIFPTLIFGRTLHIIADPVKYHSRTLLHYLDEQQIHLLDAVPSYMQAVLNEVAPEQPANALRYLLIGGEKIEQRLLQAIFGQLGAQVEVVNIYGLTEISDINILGGIRADLGTPITVGRPLQNNRIYILDAFDQPQPVGIAGEVCVGGESVSRGYLFRPELTAERFVVCPFEDGQIMVRTGDLGRWRPDGTVEILGRIDHQVKIRGFRIETGEIEALLATHPDVGECVVVAREDGAGDRRLIAYVEQRTKEQRTKEQSSTASLPSPAAAGEGRARRARGEGLRSFLQSRLPEYMVPAAFVTLPALPKTPSGKIDRKALPAPELSVEQDAAFVAPIGAREELLAQIWADVLGMARVGRDDNFFTLGGHSLLATQMLARARDALGADVRLRDLFETPTVAGLAQRIDELRHEQHSTTPAVAPIDRTQPLPLSFGQQRFWFLDQLLPNSPAYSITVAARLTGTLDRDALQQSLSALVERHESLRTIFAQTADSADEPVQIILPAAAVALPLVDLQALQAGRIEPRTEALLAAESARPFDLRRGPLLRTTLIRQGPQAHVLLLALHHIITDGWSMNVLVRELAALYRSFTQPDAPIQLPPLPIQYADYAVWQRQWLSGELLAAELDYWRKQLAGPLPVLSLPLDHPRPAVQSARGGNETLVLAPALAESLKTLSRHEGATLFMTLLAAFDVLLYRYTGQHDLLVGTPIAGRVRPELEGVVGLFLNTLVLRADLSDAPSFRELLGQVRATTLAAFDHQALPFERLVEELQPERDLSHTPVFQVLFNLLNFAEVAFDLPDLQLSVSDPPLPAKFDLTLTLAETPAGLVVSFGYNADLFEPATIARMAAHWQTLLTEIVADPAQSIAVLPLLTEDEREHVLHGWNPAPTSSTQRLVPDLFEAQAARTPNTIALIAEHEQLTYAELNARANQLARYLRAQGVGRSRHESLVGLLVERSAAMVVAVLAILKAGGAYVPLDPAQPPERLQFMIDDARLDLLLTEQAIAAHLSQIVADQTAASAQQPQQWRIVNLDSDWPLIARHEAHDLELPIAPEQLAYIMYTSGSTGTPKGVAVAHSSMSNFLDWMQQTYPLASDDRVLQAVPLGFDISVREIFWPLIVGAQLVLAQAGGQSDVHYLIAAIERWNITQMRFVPPLLQIFLEAPDLSRCHTLRRVFCGGETMPAVLAQRFFAQLDAELHNTYGPTETTVNTSAWACSPAAADFIPLGQPVANTQLYVLDSQLQPVPLGVVGELCIGGAGLARGYLNRPDLTAACFVPDPFSQSPGARLYRSGDLVRRYVDGSLEFIGRNDAQIKLRGLRIETGEIESVLRQHEAVRDTVVVLRADPEPRLVAYVVENLDWRTQNLKDEELGFRFLVLGSAELRSFARDRLPEYMIPSVIVPLDALP
ncbi:MAG: amino acid adenylation domain-containing protein [Chloroflexi bacterium]|nr:amino acid adenylation domain-containing protein [Chloroflexota bacterium]